MRIFLFAVVVGSVCAAVPHQEERIVSGVNATEGEFPFMVALRKRNTTSGVICGGTVLTKSYVLTAAHCCDKIKKKEDFYVYAGSIYLSKGGTNHSIQEMSIHGCYEPNVHWRSDYCIVKVSPSFALGSKINQTILAPTNWDVNMRDRATVAGWGLTTPSSTKPHTPDRLQKGVNFVMLSKYECQRRTGFELDSSQICARGGQAWQATWKGDSGGPLIKDGVQIGVASFGYHPCGTRLPTVYAAVMNINMWLGFKVDSEADQLKFANKTR